MLYRLLVVACIGINLSYSAASSSTAIMPTDASLAASFIRFAQHGLQEAINIYTDVSTDGMVYQINDPKITPQSVALSVVLAIHPNKLHAQIFARHASAADNFVDGQWYQAACNEIMWISPNRASSAQRAPALPEVVALVTIMRDDQYELPLYQLHVQRPRRSHITKFSCAGELDQSRFFDIGNYGIERVCTRAASECASGKQTWWQNYRHEAGHIGIEFNHEVVQTTWDELFFPEKIPTRSRSASL